MATSGSKTDGSDELFDFVCSPCSKRERNAEAVKYCADCQDYLCTTCLEYHKNFSVLVGHKLLGRSLFGTASRTNTNDLPSVPTERCKFHTMKLVDMYCVDHDSVGCHVCFTINHKLCQNIRYIPEYVQTTDQTSHIRSLEDEIKDSISRVGELMKQKQKARDDNNKRKAHSLKEIKAFRREINQTLDQLEQASIDELDKKYNKLDSTLDEEVNNIQEALDDLKKRMTEIESSRGNPSQQFVSSKLSQAFISETEQDRYGRENEKKDSHAFVRNPEILDLLQKLHSLGKKLKVSLYQVLDKKSYCVKQQWEKFDASIWSSCMLDSGDIMLADFNNKNIKLVECKTYSVQYSLKMPSAPTSVCAVSSMEVAVSLCSDMVQFVSIGNQLTLTRSLKFEHSCAGNAVMGGQLLLSEVGGSKVYIYTMDGKRLKTISSDESGNELFKCIREISIGYDGSLIHVTDGDEGLMTINKDGKVIWHYYGQGMKSAMGVCTDGEGNVFVSDTGRRSVVQIGSDGQYLGDIVPSSYDLTDPKAVCFHEETSTLTVAGENRLHVFHIN